LNRSAKKRATPAAPPPYTSAPANGKPSEKVEVSEKQLEFDAEEGEPVNKREPRNLRKPALTTQIIIWTITIALPLLFLILAIVTATADHDRADAPKVQAVEQAIKIAVTSWPIVFAAIVAQSLKALATYKVERGVEMMVCPPHVLSFELY
jgi:ABC-type Fe3+ transport system permease subunit